MFNRMQDLPIRYFDTHNHGDIMSYYTNDIDTLRQMISQSFPQLTDLRHYAADGVRHHDVLQRLAGAGGGGWALSAWCLSARDIGGRSSKYFLRQQQAMATHRGLYGRDDERPEGHQGVLP